MSHPDHALWQQSWRANQIGFHLLHVHPLLVRFWPALGLDTHDRVFVPLCGKSLDLMWLHEQGHDIIGVELSPVAVRDFFKESELQAERKREGGFLRWTQERLTIYCGDFFNLGAADVVGVKAVYDRASLTALPEGLREHYVAHLRHIIPADCKVLLLTVEDLDDDESELEASIASAEIVALYAPHFSVELSHAECFQAIVATDGEVLEPRNVHKAYILRPH